MEAIYYCIQQFIYKLQGRDMRGLYNHVKRSIGLDGRQAGGQQFDHVVCPADRNKGNTPTVGAVPPGSQEKHPTLNHPSCNVEDVQQRPTAPATGGLVHLGSTPTPEETRMMAARTGDPQLVPGITPYTCKESSNIDSADGEHRCRMLSRHPC